MSGTIPRMAYLRKLQTHLIERIFQDYEKQRQHQLYLIAEENQKLLRCNHATFLFNGEWCPWGKPLAPDSNRTLHPSLRNKVAELFEQTDYDFRDIRAGIESLIGNALALARNTVDFAALLPAQFLIHVPVIESMTFDIGDPLTVDEIKLFHEQNFENLKFLKRMLITQLLTAKH